MRANPTLSPHHARRNLAPLEKQNDDYYLTKQFCVATATGCPENLEIFSSPSNEPTERAQMGAAWRYLV
jgi:hypothetical protein